MSADMPDFANKQPVKQVTFAASPVTIPSTDLILAGIEGDTSLSQAIVKGTIQVTDSNNPSLTKNVLVAVSSEADHTYAKQPNKKKITDSSSSSDDTSSSSESEVDVDKVLGSLAKDTVVFATYQSPEKPATNGLLDTTPAATPGAESDTPNPVSRKRGRGCGNCAGCMRDDCGKCNYCLDKPKFGGPGRKKQKCALRICAHFKSAHPRKQFQMAIVAPSPSTATTITTISQPTESIPAKSIITSTPLAPSSSAVTTPTNTSAGGGPVLLNVQSLLSGTNTSTPASQGKPKQPEVPVTSSAAVSSLLEQLMKSQNTSDADKSPDSMKCVWCTRGRKLNIAYSKKFCSSRCFKNWSEIHPGKDPATAEPDNSFFMPIIDKDMPPALRKLRINMALPGSTHQQQNLSATNLESPEGSPAPAKRPDEVSPGVPTKKTKVDSPLKSATRVQQTLSTEVKETKTDLNTVSVNLWSIEDVMRYFDATPDCQAVGPLLYDQEVDGQALLLLSHDSLVKCLGIKLGPALKVMTHVERLRAQQSLVL